MRYETYSEYLASDHWDNLRQQKIAASGRVCAVCKRDDGKIICHHIHYKPDIHDCTIHDVIMLCDACHRDFHTACSERGLKPHNFPSRGNILSAIESWRQSPRTKILPTALPKRVRNPPKVRRSGTQFLGIPPGTPITPRLVEYVLVGRKNDIGKAEADLLGVRFPPEKGWRKRLDAEVEEGKLYTRESYYP